MTDKRDHFRVALVQMRSGRDVRENLLEAEAFIRDAARKGAQFIQTPENTLLMETETARLFEKIAPEEATEAVSHFSALAKSLGVWLHIGSIAIKVGEKRAVNRAFLFAPDGQIVLRYDKIHMFDVNLPSGENYRSPQPSRRAKPPMWPPCRGARLALEPVTTSASPSNIRRLRKRGRSSLPRLRPSPRPRAKSIGTSFFAPAPSKTAVLSSRRRKAGGTQTAGQRMGTALSCRPGAIFSARARRSPKSSWRISIRRTWTGFARASRPSTIAATST